MTIYAIQSETGIHQSRLYRYPPPTLQGHSNNHASQPFNQACVSNTSAQLLLADAHLRRVIDGPPPVNRQCRSKSPKSSDSAVPSYMSELSTNTFRGEHAEVSKSEAALATTDQLIRTPSIRLELSATFPNLLRDVLVLRDEVLGQMIILDNAREDYGHQQEHTSSIQSQFMKASETFMASTMGSGTASDSHRDLREIWEQLQKSKDNLRVQEDRVRNMEKDLQKKYGRLFSQESLLYDEIRQRRKDVRSSIGSELESDEDSIPISAHSGTEDDTDPRAQAYYDQLGDVKLYRERLFNFEATYQQKILVREEQKELGVTLDSSDAEFYKEHLRERVALTEDIVKMTNEVQRLKKECNEAGTVVEEPNWPLLADNLDHLLRVPRRALHYPAPPSSARGLLNPDIVLLFGDIDNKARVGRWLSEVQKADRTDSFDVFELDLETELKANAHTFTEQEAENLLPFPDYGLLLASGFPLIVPEVARRPEFIPDPPQRRYSEPTIQTWRFDVSSIRLKVSRSVR